MPNWVLSCSVLLLATAVSVAEAVCPLCETVQDFPKRMQFLVAPGTRCQDIYVELGQYQPTDEFCIRSKNLYQELCCGDEEPEPIVAEDEPFEPRPPGTEIEFPFYRYRLWNDLTNTILDAAEGMGYNQPLWENPGTAGVEFFAWYALSDADKEFAATIGFEEFGWDCHMNHYDFLDWPELIEADVVQYFETLGWNEELWNDPLGTVPAEDKFYRQLSQAEKAAADAICYFEDVWNELPLPDWGELSDIPLTEAPTQTPTESVTMSPSSSPSTQPTFPPAPSAAPSTNPTGSMPTFSPSAAPSSMPVITASPTESPSTPPTHAPSAGPTVDIRKPPVDEINTPDFRYEVWASLDSETKTLAEALTWTETSWNNPGTAGVETFAYQELPEQSQADARSMGFDNVSWDCYINHYDAFRWNVLEDFDVQKYFIALGWSQQSWLGVIDPPPTEGADWASLTDEEQEAARELCYTSKELWEAIPLSDWPSNIIPTAAPTEAGKSPTVAPTTKQDASDPPTDTATAKTLLVSGGLGLLSFWMSI